jgi:hypothetical protein
MSSSYQKKSILKIPGGNIPVETFLISSFRVKKYLNLGSHRSQLVSSTMFR